MRQWVTLKGVSRKAGVLTLTRIPPINLHHASRTSLVSGHEPALEQGTTSVMIMHLTQKENYVMLSLLRHDHEPDRRNPPIQNR